LWISEDRFPAPSIEIGCPYNQLAEIERRSMMAARSNIDAKMAYIVDPGVRIGHVHLKVADLDRALAFYSGVLGLQVMQRYGDGAVFLSADGYHHHIALNTWESLGGSPPSPGTTGLYHTAIIYPTRAALADALRRVLAAKIPLQGAADHGVSESVYLADPDDNGVELYRDKPKEAWPLTPDGQLAMFTRPLDLHQLLKEAPPGSELESGPPDL
jgi:catechol 2,3-dioxygenase